MAVYTELSDEDLQGFLQHYDLGEVTSFKGIAEGVENSNYLLHTTTGRYIMTLYEKRVRPEDLPYFLGLMDHLAGRGIRCPTPLRGRDGESLRQLCGRPAVIVSFLDGLWPRRILPSHCQKLGQAMAEMHLAGADFPLSRENDLSVAGWRALFDACAPRAHEVRDGLAEEISEELAQLERAWPRDLPAGVIHADLFPDNVFFLGEELSGLIDFYFACNDQLAYDLAICLNAWCFEPDNSFNITKAKALIQNYETVRPLSGDERQALPVLARGAAMRFFVTRLHDWLSVPEGALVTPKDPLEYVRRLRFHQRVGGPEGYGIGL
jgi:homoserine kinase type II